MFKRFTRTQVDIRLINVTLISNDGHKEKNITHNQLGVICKKLIQ